MNTKKPSNILQSIKKGIITTAAIGYIGASLLSTTGCQSLRYLEYPRESARPNLSYSIDDRLLQIEFLSNNQDIVDKYLSGEEFDRNILDSVFDLSTHALVENYNDSLSRSPKESRAEGLKPLEHILDGKFNRIDSELLKTYFNNDLSRDSMFNSYINSKELLLTGVYDLFVSRGASEVEKYITRAENVSQITDLFSFMEKYDLSGVEYSGILDSIIERAVKSKNNELLNRVYIGKILNHFENDYTSTEVDGYVVNNGFIAKNFVPNTRTINNSKLETFANLLSSFNRDYFSKFESYEGQITSVLLGKDNRKLIFDSETYTSQEILSRLFKEGKDFIVELYIN